MLWYATRGASALCQRRHWCTCYACCPACCTRRSTFTCEAVVHRTLVLKAIYRSHCFHVAISVAIFLYWRCSVYRNRVVVVSPRKAWDPRAVAHLGAVVVFLSSIVSSVPV